MTFAADLLLIAAAIGAALFCLVLARRLQSLSRLDDGLGAAIAVLSAEVDTLNRALTEARDSAGASARALESGTARADQAARRLELLLAAMHDLDTSAPSAPQAPAHRESPHAAPPPTTAQTPWPAPRPQGEVPRARMIRRRHFAGVEA
jgi:hypothetical protein